MATGNLLTVGESWQEIDLNGGDGFAYSVKSPHPVRLRLAAEEPAADAPGHVLGGYTDSSFSGISAGDKAWLRRETDEDSAIVVSVA